MYTVVFSPMLDRLPNSNATNWENWKTASDLLFPLAVSPANTDGGGVLL